MRRSRFTLRRGHRWLGLALVLPLVLLAVTGIGLNHSDALRLDQRFLGQKWLLDVYGIVPRPPATGFAIGGIWISHARDLLFLDATRLDTGVTAPVGATASAGMLAVAVPEAVYLYTRAGQPVGRLPAPAGQRIEALCSSQEALLARTDGGVYRANQMLAQWREHAGDCGRVISAEPLPQALRAAIRAQLANSILTWEKVLLDVHSGRILGRIGPWLLDAAALVIIVLAITGSVVWLRIRWRTG